MNLKELRRLASGITFGTFLLSLPLPLRADALDNWTTYQLSTNNYYLNQVTYGSGSYLAVGYSCSDFGVVFTSENGRNWTLSANGCVSQTPLILIGVTHGEQTFVAVGFYSTIYSSSNGIDWVNRMWGPFYNFTSVTYGNGLFVAVGDGDLFSGGITRTNIYTSPDAITWTPQVSIAPPEEPESIWDIAFGAGRFMAVGSGGYCYTSTNGSNWSRNQIVSGDLFRSSFCNGLFFVPYGPGIN